jgi:hypothetical protein
MEQTLTIKKAYYLCSCSREYLSDDVPKICPCHMGSKDGLPLSRVETFQGKRETANGIPWYPECGVGAGKRDTGILSIL